MTYSTPYKIYDYMAAGRPILALAPRDAALYELLEDSGAGHCVEAGDIDGIEQALERTLFGGASPARMRIERFHWSNLAQDYLQAIDAAGGATPAASAEVPARALGPS
jgi:glycosyltransferase involved in cell wall biosynthesis